MAFVSAGFLVFLLILFLVYYRIPKQTQWMLLLAASLVFYAFAGISFLLYIVVITVSAWLCTRLIYQIQQRQGNYLAENKEALDREQKKLYKAKMKQRQRRWLWLALLFTIGLLAVVKYTDFAIANINAFLSLSRRAPELGFMKIALPLGLSFYTFQTVGYIIDVYRGKQMPEKNIFKLALFVSFFPQMIQGPISRFSDLAPQLFSGHSFQADRFALGLQRILWGFFKKVVIADRILAAVQTIFQEPAAYRGTYVLLGMLFYALQLYADFTGGIDITIGIAQALGIGLKENFARPFFAKNTAEYWRRWHITMGTWFRDYIFYPLSVSKTMLSLTNWSRRHLGKSVGKKIPVYLATMIVWFTTGLWHGASWNFVVWGLLNGLVIVVSQELDPVYRWFHSRVSIADRRWFHFLQVLRTFLLMSSIRLLDVYRDVGLTFRQFFSIFREFKISVLLDGSMLSLGLSAADYGILAIGTAMLITVSLLQRKGSVRLALAARPLALRYACFGLLFLLIVVFGAYGVGYDANQFIYNQF